ncbi:pilus assembly protein TadG-related protein [Azospirillum sp. sgz301742]
MRRRNWLAPTGLRSVSDLAGDDQGTVFLYFTVLAAVLFGFAGLAVDVGRLVSTNTQAKSAADASALAAVTALAAAVQAPGADTSKPQPVIDAIWQAAQQGVTNRQNYATVTKGGSTSTGGTVQITNVRMLTSLPELNGGSSSAPPDAYVTGDPWQAKFVEVTTETLSQQNFFMTAVGATPTSTTRATAIAGVDQTACNIPPLWICNPADDGSANGSTLLDPAVWRGREVLLKAAGAGSQWGPGNFGLLDTASGNGTAAVAQNLASASPSLCFNLKTVNLRPGQATPVKGGINTRFDIYENPYFGSAADAKNPDYRPAENVAKGFHYTTPSCNKTPDPDGELLTRDMNLSSTNRIGNGVWDCAKYWSDSKHTGTPPSGCTATSSMTRYEMYRHEIDNVDYTKYGRPYCYKGDKSTLNQGPDRRVLYFAMINCSQYQLNGNRDNVPIAAVGKAFLPEPVKSSPGDEIVIEIIDIARAGKDSVLHEIVQLYR